LKKYWKENEYAFDEIIIECSPFLRCLMSAAWLANELGVKTVYINYNLNQHLSYMNCGNINPMKHLELARSGGDFE